MEMKQKFINTSAWISVTGISDVLNHSMKNPKEFKENWDFFIQTCRPIVAAAKALEREFQASDKQPIFYPFENIRYPTEVACLLKIMNMDEDEIFEDTEDFKAALKREHKPLSTALAKLMETKKIKEITAENICTVK